MHILDVCIPRVDQQKFNGANLLKFDRNCPEKVKYRVYFWFFWSPTTLSMGFFLLVASPVTKLSVTPLVIPCYHCQVVKNRITLNHHPQNNNLLSFDLPELLPHQKLEELHFNYPCLGPTNMLRYTWKQLASTNATIQSKAFYRRLAKIWAINLTILRSFLVDSNSSDISICTSSLL